MFDEKMQKSALNERIFIKVEMIEMFNNVTKDQIDLLHRELIVPIAVADIATYDLNVEPDMQYGLHMALSEIDPDSALLAIALCVPFLTNRISDDYAIASVLKHEAQSIIDDYGPDWIHSHQNPPMSEEGLQQLMRTVPEDLEALADLLDALCADIDDSDSTIVILANLLSVQARAHMEIANFIVEEMKRTKVIDQIPTDGASYAEHKSLGQTLSSDNIILFPIQSEA